MKTITFTKQEIEALKHLLWISKEVCNSGCIIESMQNSKIDCSDCEFTKVISSITDKIME